MSEEEYKNRESKLMRSIVVLMDVVSCHTKIITAKKVTVQEKKDFMDSIIKLEEVEKIVLTFKK